MRKSIVSSTAFWITLFSLLPFASTALRADGGDAAKDKGQAVEKRTIVYVDEDGNQKMLEGSGPSVKRGYLGVGLTDLTPELRSHFGAPENAGVMVSKVEPGSPAAKEGFEVGDIITAVDGKPIESSFDLRARMRKAEEGARLAVEIRRNGKVQTLSPAVELRDRAEIEMAPFFKKLGDENGLILRELRDGPGRIAVQPLARRSPREAELEKRLKDLEKRLAELESRLPKQ